MELSLCKVHGIVCGVEFIICGVVFDKAVGFNVGAGNRAPFCIDDELGVGHLLRGYLRLFCLELNKLSSF